MQGNLEGKEEGRDDDLDGGKGKWDWEWESGKWALR